MVLWFMRRNYLNDPTLFLHFCDYPPLKGTWTFIWINLIIPINSSCKICLYKVWLQMACWFWRRFFFPNINIIEYGFPYRGPSWLRGPWFQETWIYIISESFHVNMTYSDSVVLEKKIFKWPHPIFAFLRLSSLWRGPSWPFIWTI
jgi:hypothetical protein